jgi:hypothetical protein
MCLIRMMLSYRDLFLADKELNKAQEVEITDRITKDYKPAITVPHLIKLEELIHNKNFDVRFKTGKKGGLRCGF